MSIFKELDGRAHRLSAMDIGLIKWCMLICGLIIAKVFPQLLDVSYLKLIIIAVLLGIKPVYVFWIKKDKEENNNGKD
ncbi:MAG: hypothetical protein P9L88_01385 [Candidatus Tantalella remota]|nr:hypothetical protein [Candidatus Tantalella remota]